MAYKRRSRTRQRSRSSYAPRKAYARKRYSSTRKRAVSRRRAPARAQTLRIVLQTDPNPQLAMLGATGETVSSVRETAPRKKAQF